MSIKDKRSETGLSDSRNKELTTLFTGRNCIILDETDSTNTYLSQLISSKVLPEGSVVRTNRQNRGRGQQGATWVSEDGKNLLLSFAFYPAFIQPKNVFQLNKAFALGVFDFVSKFLGEKVSIKWPNDIYYDNKKIGGLLIENTISGNKLTSSVLGIGLNVNQRVFPDDLPNPSSFSLIKEVEFDLEILFAALCAKLENRYLSLKRGEWEKIETGYLAVLYNYNMLKKYRVNGEVITGTIKGVNGYGKLIVQKEDQLFQLFDIKEIVFLPND